MNANRLINMAFRMILRHFSKGKKMDPNAKKALDAMKLARRFKR